MCKIQWPHSNSKRMVIEYVLIYLLRTELLISVGRNLYLCLKGCLIVYFLSIYCFVMFHFRFFCFHFLDFKIVVLVFGWYCVFQTLVYEDQRDKGHNIDVFFIYLCGCVHGPVQVHYGICWFIRRKHLT